jgi:hypothetical protein
MEKAAARVLREIREACAACRTANAPITLHHMSYERLGAEHDDDLLALCRPCHDRVHRIYRRRAPKRHCFFWRTSNVPRSLF